MYRRYQYSLMMPWQRERVEVQQTALFLGVGCLGGVAKNTLITIPEPLPLVPTTPNCYSTFHTLFALIMRKICRGERVGGVEVQQTALFWGCLGGG